MIKLYKNYCHFRFQRMLLVIYQMYTAAPTHFVPQLAREWASVGNKNYTQYEEKTNKQTNTAQKSMTTLEILNIIDMISRSIYVTHPFCIAFNLKRIKKERDVVVFAISILLNGQ